MILVVLPVGFLPQLVRDFVWQADGSILVSTQPDGVLHLGVTQQLVHSFPLRSPFAAGMPLSYHYGMDLVPAVLHRFLGIPVADACLRLVPTMLLALVFLSAYIFGRRWLGSVFASTATALMVVLAEGMGYMPGLVTGNQNIWAVHYFDTPAIVSLYWANPNLPALAFFFAGMWALLRGLADSDRRWSWFLASSVILGVMGSFKIFFIAHTMAALAIAAALCLLRRDRRLAEAVFVTGAACVVLVLPLILPHLGSSVIRVAPTFQTHYWPAAIWKLGLGQIPGFASVVEMAIQKKTSVGGILFGFTLALPLFVLGSFGVRSLGLGGLFRSLVRWKHSPPLDLFFAIFVVLGWLITPLFLVPCIDQRRKCCHAKHCVPRSQSVLAVSRADSWGPYVEEAVSD
ncbi:MAG: hypothetical protein GY937_06330 [bacterium]|nr:hypothetical protein [bacterium]